MTAGPPAISRQTARLLAEAAVGGWADTRDGKATYLVYGKVDFFGEAGMARTDGAGGQSRTGYARLFRAALYR